MKRKSGIAKHTPKLAFLQNDGISNFAEAGTREIRGFQNEKVADLTAEDNIISFDELNVAVSNSLPNKSTRKMSRSLNQDPEYKEEELKVALEIIRKVMKMDAAKPFNIPVDPVALGTPDYFDVIDTPIDFGTICCILNTSKVQKLERCNEGCGVHLGKLHKAVDRMSNEQQLNVDEEIFLSPTKPTAKSSIYGNRNPSGSLANFARSLRENREDLIRPQVDYPSLGCTKKTGSKQRPGHYQAGLCIGCAEDNMRRNPVNVVECIFTHADRRPNPHEIPHPCSSLGKSKPYKPQQKFCHCHLSFLHLRNSHQRASTFIPSADPVSEILVLFSFFFIGNCDLYPCKMWDQDTGTLLDKVSIT